MISFLFGAVNAKTTWSGYGAGGVRVLRPGLWILVRALGVPAGRSRVNANEQRAKGPLSRIYNTEGGGRCGRPVPGQRFTTGAESLWKSLGVLARKSWLPGMCANAARPNVILKPHLLRHCLTVLVAQMAVGFHRQGPAVLVAEPARYRWNVHAGFNAPRGEQVAQVVVGKP